MINVPIIIGRLPILSEIFPILGDIINCVNDEDATKIPNVIGVAPNNLL